MSRLVQRLRGGRSVTVVSGTLSGSGTLAIPQGVSLVSLTGRGGNGGDSSWYDPGQAYIAPSGYHAEQPYIAPTSADWGSVTATYMGSQTTAPGAIGGPLGSPVGNPSYIGQTYSNTYWAYGAPNYYQYTQSWTAVSISSPGQPYIGPYYDFPGQPYIAPSSGGGPYTGTSTTSTLNGVTRTWIGGYNSGGVGATSTQTLNSTGAGQSLTYSIPGTGALSYSYEL